MLGADAAFAKTERRGVGSPVYVHQVAIRRNDLYRPRIGNLLRHPIHHHIPVYALRSHWNSPRLFRCHVR